MKDKVKEWVEKELAAIPEDKRREVEAAIRKGAHYADIINDHKWDAEPGELPTKACPSCDSKKVMIVLKRGDKKKGKPDEGVFMFHEWP